MAKAKQNQQTDTLDVEALTRLINPAFTEDQLKKLPDNEGKIFINYKIIPIDLLVKADWNYKVDDEATGEKLRNNLKRIGQTENVHVRLLKTGFFEVVNGNHRLDELRTIGIKNVICYDHGTISLAEAKRIAIETNETKFDADDERLKQTITDILDEFGYDNVIDTLPYDEDALNEILSVMEDAESAAPTTSDVFHINIQCEDESHAAELYERFTKEGLKTKIIS